MDELKTLAEAAGYEVVGSLEQVTRPSSRFQIGSGKVEELAEMAKELNAEKIVFGNELKIIQVYNLAKAVGVEVIDRLQLILEIFQKRASTEEANLQIELARWRHELAHARQKVRLTRLGEQPGFHGLGKYEVDVYHDSVKRQVLNIEEKLRDIRKTRRLHRTRRQKQGFQSASLAGYTSSGKSTLFNALAVENVPVNVGLFTTLSTTTRAINVHDKKILLTDTVGFIDNLPLTLVEAFYSTLEETILSDLILLVVDVSEPQDEIERKLSCCLDTIREIGAGSVPIITVLNKIDLISAETLNERTENLKDRLTSIVPISALYRTNLDFLENEMNKNLIHYMYSFVTLPTTEKSLSLLSWIYDHAKVQNVEYEEGFVNVAFGASPQITEKIRYDTEKLGGVFRLGQTENLGSQVKPQV
jgi:GTP-binding protein HflX